VKKLFAILLATAAITASAADITGAGATFPMPIYSKWAEGYKKATGNSLNYQSIGSSGGIRQINAKTVDFGATDAPVKGEELDKNGQVQFPAIIGGTVPVVNLDGIKPGELKITGPVMAEVFMGTIAKWNDPKLLALNPGKTLPDAPITVVHRADGSGTTFNWTDYLATVSPEWEKRVGRGAIGYVEYAYVKKNNMTFLQLQNKSGKYVSPDDLTFAAAADGADWFSVSGMGLSIVDQKNPNAWPVSSASFIIMYKEPKNKATSDEVLKFFDWAFKNGKKDAVDLDYVPLPDALTKQIRERVWTQKIDRNFNRNLVCRYCICSSTCR